MTNGEKLKETFPNMKITLLESYVQVMGENYEFNNTYPFKWWDAEYKEPTTKNVLAVDCIVDVLGSYTDLDIPYKHEIAENILAKLSSVTLIRPKGRWVLDGTGIDAWDYIEGYSQIHCTNCGHKIKGKNIECTDFCPKCGADMRGEEE